MDCWRPSRDRTAATACMRRVTAGDAEDNHWYEFRALYDVIDGPDMVDIDYRDITAGGEWTDLAVFDMDEGVDNEMTAGGGLQQLRYQYS